MGSLLPNLRLRTSLIFTNNFYLYNVLLAIATNIPQRLKTGFVVQGHIFTVVKRAQHAANRKKHLQIKETTSSILQRTRCKCSQHNQKRNGCKYILFGCVVSICTICCQNDENVFLICWCFFYLHVFFEVAARWALSATVHFCISFIWRNRVWSWINTMKDAFISLIN